MQLSDALFDYVTSTLHCEPADATPPGAPEQRRREPRVGVRAQVTVIPLSDSLQVAPFEVPLRDLSAGGVGFVHTCRMSLDEQFVVILPGGSESVAVLCQVAHYQPLAEQAFAVGARFVRVLRQPAAAPDGGGIIGFPRQATERRRVAS